MTPLALAEQLNAQGEEQSARPVHIKDTNSVEWHFPTISEALQHLQPNGFNPPSQGKVVWWMWDDAGIVSSKLARQNPMRRTSLMVLIDAIQSLRNVDAKDARRPVRLSVNASQQVYQDADHAADFLQSIQEAPPSDCPCFCHHGETQTGTVWKCVRVPMGIRWDSCTMTFDGHALRLPFCSSCATVRITPDLSVEDSLVVSGRAPTVPPGFKLGPMELDNPAGFDVYSQGAEDPAPLVLCTDNAEDRKRWTKLLRAAAADSKTRGAKALHVATPVTAATKPKAKPPPPPKAKAQLAPRSIFDDADAACMTVPVAQRKVAGMGQSAADIAAQVRRQDAGVKIINDDRLVFQIEMSMKFSHLGAVGLHAALEALDLGPEGAVDWGSFTDLCKLLAAGTNDSESPLVQIADFLTNGGHPSALRSVEKRLVPLAKNPRPVQRLQFLVVASRIREELAGASDQLAEFVETARDVRRSSERRGILNLIIGLIQGMIKNGVLRNWDKTQRGSCAFRIGEMLLKLKAVNMERPATAPPVRRYTAVHWIAEELERAGHVCKSLLRPKLMQCRTATDVILCLDGPTRRLLGYQEFPASPATDGFFGQELPSLHTVARWNADEIASLLITVRDTSALVLEELVDRRRYYAPVEARLLSELAAKASASITEAPSEFPSAIAASSEGCNAFIDGYPGDAKTESSRLPLPGREAFQRLCFYKRGTFRQQRNKHDRRSTPMSLPTNDFGVNELWLLSPRALPRPMRALSGSISALSGPMSALQLPISGLPTSKPTWRICRGHIDAHHLVFKSKPPLHYEQVQKDLGLGFVDRFWYEDAAMPLPGQEVSQLSDSCSELGRWLASLNLHGFELRPNQFAKVGQSSLGLTSAELVAGDSDPVLFLVKDQRAAEWWKSTLEAEIAQPVAGIRRIWDTMTWCSLWVCLDIDRGELRFHDNSTDEIMAHRVVVKPQRRVALKHARVQESRSEEMPFGVEISRDEGIIAKIALADSDEVRAWVSALRLVQGRATENVGEVSDSLDASVTSLASVDGAWASGVEGTACRGDDGEEAPDADDGGEDDNADDGFAVPRVLAREDPLAQATSEEPALAGLKKLGRLFRNGEERLADELEASREEAQLTLQRLGNRDSGARDPMLALPLLLRQLCAFDRELVAAAEELAGAR